VFQKASAGISGSRQSRSAFLLEVQRKCFNWLGTRQSSVDYFWLFGEKARTQRQLAELPKVGPNSNQAVPHMQNFGSEFMWQTEYFIKLWPTAERRKTESPAANAA